MTTLRAKGPFTAFVNGQALPVPAGELLDSSHPVVQGREELFEKVEDFVNNVGRKTSVSRDDKPRRSEVLMERATSEPGEKRSVSPKPSQDEDRPAPRRTPAKAEASTAKDKKDGEV